MGGALAVILPLVLQLLGQVIPALGPLIVALINNLTASLNDNAEVAVMVANEIVAGIERNEANSALPGAEKRQMALDALKITSPGLTDSMANCLVELAVQKMKEKAA